MSVEPKSKQIKKLRRPITKSEQDLKKTIVKMATDNAPCPFDEAVTRLIRYQCSCGISQPLCKLYFCRHCLDLRCGFCVSHEVDSHYCPNCLENMPSAEARLKKNRCANCFDCPSCGHTLSTRATSMQIQAPTEDGTNVKMVTKKVYYLACAFCRWTSRDVGIPDQVKGMATIDLGYSTLDS
jgi:hypothetical protein